MNFVTMHIPVFISNCGGLYGKCQLSGFAEHKALHDEFSAEVLQIYNDVRDGKHVLSSDVMKRLTTRLQEHILQF